MMRSPKRERPNEPTLPTERLINELQSFGIRLVDPTAGESRRGGAGPSDHMAVTIEDATVMVSVCAPCPVAIAGPDCRRTRLKR